MIRARHCSGTTIAPVWIIRSWLGDSRVSGLDIATQLGTAGLRAELTHARREDGTHYERALLGTDYAFANTLTLGGELYFNGAGSSDRSAYDFPSLFAGRIHSVARRYAGAYARYEVSPLVDWATYLVLNLDDRSSFFSPSLSYSLAPNVDLTIGAQWLQGGTGSEFAQLHDTYYAQFQWFF